MRYNPALDGLRAVAILLVLSSHTLGFINRGGWTGVDVFFTLSGYLITSILLHELRTTGEIDFRNFYIRRALRLTPALAILVAFEVARSFFLPNGREIREATLVAVTYIEDFNLVFKLWPTDFVGSTWSLAVEEQFYLLWPLALIFVFTRHPLRWLCVAIAAMIIARVIFWHGGNGDTETADQYSPLIRPAGLLIECALAFLPQWRAPSWTALVSLLMILTVTLTNQTSALAYIMAPASASGATTLLIASTWHSGATSATLSFPPLRYIGKISYGIYLYHFPIFMLGEQHKVHLPFFLFGAFLIALVLGVAALSYEFVEKPILGLKSRFHRTRVEPQAEGLRAA